MNYLNQLLNSNDKEKVWHTIDSETKKTIIKHMFNTKTDNHIKLARELLKIIREDDKLCRRDIHAGYVNLLCVLLAKSHNPEYIKDIVKTKCCGDLFYYVDSNLLFEFSPKQKRETCIKDTMEYVNNMKCKEKWFEIYKGWVNHYGKHYDELTVIKYWNKYKEPDYCKRFCQ